MTPFPLSSFLPISCLLQLYLPFYCHCCYLQPNLGLTTSYKEHLNCWFLNLTPFVPPVFLPATPSGEARLIKGQVSLNPEKGWKFVVLFLQKKKGGEQKGPMNGRRGQEATTSPLKIPTHITSTEPTIKCNQMN